MKKALEKFTGKKLQWEAMDDNHAEQAKGSKTAVRGSGSLVSDKDAPKSR